jgi:hypothetical protein
VNVENKIVLAMATRLAAEKYMAERLADDKLISSIFPRRDLPKSTT